jgi:arylsulfatase A
LTPAHRNIEFRATSCRRGHRVARALPAILILASFACTGPAVVARQEPLPNVIIILIDDLGYADIGPFGETRWPTPGLDRMATQGRRFTDFLVSSAVCSASRAALLTGCCHERLGIRGALGPNSRIGLNPAETTLAELCRSRGYATACVGKWHLGDQAGFLPLAHGFDEYYGLPYSNDMWPFHPDYVELPPAAAGRKRGYPDLPVYDGNTIVDEQVTAEDQKRLTADYTRRSVEFIERNAKKDANGNASRPFFLYLAHSMVHVPLFVSPEFEGRSGQGMFADAVMEIDWSVEQILETLESSGVAENTLVVFLSDNGPWLSYGNHAGSAGPLREGKGTMFEGGCRVSALMQWPAKIPAGTTCNELCSSIDLLPTIAACIGASLPDNRIDGKNILPLMTGESDAVSPHNALACYYNGELRAIRDRRWKLVFPHEYRTMAGQSPGADGKPGAYRQQRTEQVLFDLHTDIGESVDVSDANPEVVERLSTAADATREDLGDTLRNISGTGIRPAGTAR